MLVCVGPKVALRYISRGRNNRVAYGSKRTSNGRNYRLDRKRMTICDIGWFKIMQRSSLTPLLSMLSFRSEARESPPCLD